MRLINADALMEKVSDRTKHIPLYAPFKVCTADVVDLKFLLNSEPTIEAVPVVRCRECKHYEESTGWCMKHSHFVDSNGFFCYPYESPEWKMFKEDDFCSYGERRSDER